MKVSDKLFAVARFTTELEDFSCHEPTFSVRFVYDYAIIEFDHYGKQYGVYELCLKENLFDQFYEIFCENVISLMRDYDNVDDAEKFVEIYIHNLVESFFAYESLESFAKNVGAYYEEFISESFLQNLRK